MIVHPEGREPVNLGFNPTAFVAPTTRGEYVALLQEAVRVMEEVGEMLDQRGRQLARLRNQGKI
ncbi:hypothetical protein [Achromobacter phage Motura]|uniref:Uncharacterized protein n=1 Tax=Achromobacter phage Motura TaxID=2591403 RepID=A0A514CTC2_9CAUD|nr:hypothetical protein H1O15_gp111 [Achromobacter phage Motura]QDH83716.1 hypothetical protein [Achromobacter phage Motura]